MTLHPSEFQDDITVGFVVDQLDVSTFHVTLRPIIRELIAVPLSFYREPLLRQLRQSLLKLYLSERRTLHHWHRGQTVHQASVLDTNGWVDLERLDALLASAATRGGISEDAMMRYLNKLGESEQRKRVLGRTFESFGTGLPSAEV